MRRASMATIAVLGALGLGACGAVAAFVFGIADPTGVTSGARAPRRAPGALVALIGGDRL